MFFFITRKPLPFNLSKIFGIGAVIQVEPLTMDFLCLPIRETGAGTLLDTALLIRTPRKEALSALALVTSVFSKLSSNLSLLRKEPISSLISFAFFLLPHTPMIQSSAYRTYSNLIFFGLGIEDLCLLLTLTSFFSSGLPPTAAFSPASFFIFAIW